MSESSEVARRQVLITGAAAAAAPLLRGAAPALVRRADAVGAQPPGQVHVQFGEDAAAQVAVSWAAAAPASRPRLRLGDAEHGFGGYEAAEERVYTEALTGQTVYAYHARLASLMPDTDYIYEVLHDGAPPVPGTFRTGPRGRSRGFRFTSFGDQSIPAPVGLGPASANAGYIVDAVEALDPLFHLMNGDLCYANVSDLPVQTWARSRSRTTGQRPARASTPSSTSSSCASRCAGNRTKRSGSLRRPGTEDRPARPAQASPARLAAAFGLVLGAPLGNAAPDSGEVSGSIMARDRDVTAFGERGAGYEDGRLGPH